MYLQRQYQPGRKWLARLPFESDLLGEIEKFAAEQNIKVGQVKVIGAVKKAVLGFYDQQSKEYRSLYFNKPLEILHCSGNLSIKDGTPKAHLHIALGSEDGAALGGHLLPGTIVFAGEAVIEELIGPEMVRGYDLQTGLPLWEK
ncbi:MAG: DNA-binding protein [Firmicutes bacterium]|nr:DNA-binding protein [Bacillota bacterium]